MRVRTTSRRGLPDERQEEGSTRLRDVYGYPKTGYVGGVEDVSSKHDRITVGWPHFQFTGKHSIN